MFGELTKPLTFDFQSYINELQANPWQYFTLALDIVIVCFLLYEFVKFTKKSRVWQLLKGKKLSPLRVDFFLLSRYYLKRGD